MAIHTADLIAVQERWLSSVMLENRSCSRSSYLKDRCWQPTQVSCTLPCFFLLLALNLLFPLLALPRITVVLLPRTFHLSLHLVMLYGPPQPTRWLFVSMISVTTFYSLYLSSPFLFPQSTQPTFHRFFPHPLTSLSLCLIPPSFLTSFNIFTSSNTLYHLYLTLPSTLLIHPLFYQSVHRIARASYKSQM